MYATVANRTLKVKRSSIKPIKVNRSKFQRMNATLKLHGELHTVSAIGPHVLFSVAVFSFISFLTLARLIQNCH